MLIQKPERTATGVTRAGRAARRCASRGGIKGITPLAVSYAQERDEDWCSDRPFHRALRQIAVCSHRPYGFPFLSAQTTTRSLSDRAPRLESFTISPDGHYVGQDGFLVPKNFEEFFERDPLWVRHWLTKRMRGRAERDAILDLAQDLLLYLCSLPEKSKFRRKGRNGRADGCTDVIQCFDPVRHNPLHHSNNLNISGPATERGSSEGSGEASEEYLLIHSSILAMEYRKRKRSENILLRIFIKDFVSFTGKEAPELLAIIDAIQSTATSRKLR
jgi:hypothetical protein